MSDNPLQANRPDPATRAPIATVTVVTLAALVALSVVVMFWSTWPMDLAALYYAAQAVGAGDLDLVYSAPEGFFGRSANPQWETAAAAEGGGVVTPYLYPPIWAWIMAPVAAEMDATTFFRLVLVAQAIVVCLGTVLAAKLVGGATTRGLSLALILVPTLAPFTMAFALGQIEVFVVVMILGALLAGRAGRGILGGVVLGLAAAIKVVPILFAWVAWRQGRRDMAVVALLVSGGIAVLSVAVAGWPMHLTYLERLSSLSDVLLIHRSAGGFERVVARFLDLPTVWQEMSPSGMIVIVEAPGWLRPVSLTLLAITTAAWVLGVRRWASQALGIAVLLYLFGPLGWLHYLMLPALVVTVMIWSRPFDRIALLMLLSLLMIHFVPILLAGSDARLNLLIVALHTAWAFIALAYAAWWDRQPLHPDAPSL